MTEKTIKIPNIAIVGESDFFNKRLYPLLMIHDYKVDIFTRETLNINQLSTPGKYNLIIFSLDIFNADEKLFDFIIHSNNILFADEKNDNVIQSPEPFFYINNLMSSEEIMTKVNHIIYQNTHKDERVTRQSIRKKVNIAVEYTVRNNTYLSKLINISANGGFILTLNPPDQNSSIKLLFSPNNGQRKIEATGRVVHKVGFNLEKGIISPENYQQKKITAFPGIGFFFEDISETDKNLISIIIT